MSDNDGENSIGSHGVMFDDATQRQFQLLYCTRPSISLSVRLFRATMGRKGSDKSACSSLGTSFFFLISFLFVVLLLSR
ncbi:hypothetical protein BDV39DRAFT_167961 [Aspergillus sergii]|uniref:Transmembrane protein n=1 Tax=Aspergillus sergii TaxID=1034303 RepID=A0A5N6XHX4_9EURO|nr:hypothetical protein BDV39DRAFT_167961 [Aspergillus sergii]